MVNGTHDKIIHALFKLALKNPNQSHFTLSELAIEAKISRQAISAKHFDSTEQILKEVRNRIDKEIQLALSRYVVSKDESPYLVLANVVAPIVYKHREHIRILYNTALDPTWTKFLDEKHRIWLEPYIKNCPESLHVSHDFLLKLLPRQVTILFAVWLSDEFPEPPEVFTKTFLSLITHPPVDFLSIR